MSANIFELLRKRYEGAAWAFLEEVRNGTGYSRGPRTADALAMSLWPSRGLHLHGFEVKVSRSDWKKELDDPAKAEEIARFCQFWWLVIDDQKIVQNGELPATWGLLVRHGDKLKAEREPTFNKDALAPTHAFLAAVLRKVAATSTDAARIERATKDGYDKGWLEGRSDMEQYTTEGRTKATLEGLQTKVDDFQKRSGVRISEYTGPNVASAMALLLNEYHSPLTGLDRLARDAEDIAKRARGAADAARAAIKPAPADEEAVA